MKRWPELRREIGVESVKIQLKLTSKLEEALCELMEAIKLGVRRALLDSQESFLCNLQHSGLIHDNCEIINRVLQPDYEVESSVDEKRIPIKDRPDYCYKTYKIRVYIMFDTAFALEVLAKRNKDRELAVEAERKRRDKHDAGRKQTDDVWHPCRICGKCKNKGRDCYCFVSCDDDFDRHFDSFGATLKKPYVYK